MCALALVFIGYLIWSRPPAGFWSRWITGQPAGYMVVDDTLTIRVVVEKESNDGIRHDALLPVPPGYTVRIRPIDMPDPKPASLDVQFSFEIKERVMVEPIVMRDIKFSGDAYVISEREVNQLSSKLFRTLNALGTSLNFNSPRTQITSKSILVQPNAQGVAFTPFETINQIKVIFELVLRSPT
jgi:hypothetical protein